MTERSATFVWADGTIYDPALPGYRQATADELARNGLSTRLVIYAGGAPGHWTARAYDDTTDEHLWSSEDASSLDQALSEVAEGISSREARAHPDAFRREQQ